jgi:hypothetical protein
LLSAKRNNSLIGITGLMSYSKGYYFQIIEGDDKDVAKLVDVIRKDSRHHDIQTILDIPIKHRHFRKWSMRLVPLLANCHEFQDFMMQMDVEMESLSPKNRALIEIFYQSVRHPDLSKPDAGNWNSCEFSMDHWPDFSEIKPTIQLMSLCGALFHNTTSYQELSSDSHYGSEVELRSTLKNLNKSRCLITSKIVEQPETGIPHGYTHHPRDLTFIGKMKEFINTRMH